MQELNQEEILATSGGTNLIALLEDGVDAQLGVGSCGGHANGCGSSGSVTTTRCHSGSGTTTKSLPLHTSVI
jgi:hypothetical protein